MQPSPQTAPQQSACGHHIRASIALRSLLAGCAADAGRRIARRAPRRAPARHDLDRRHQRSARPPRGAAPPRRLPREPAARARPRRRRRRAPRRGRHVPGDAGVEPRRGRRRSCAPTTRSGTTPSRSATTSSTSGRSGPATAPRAPGDDPRGALKARAAEARFPFLAANLVDDATGAPPAWPNVRPTHDGRRRRRQDRHHRPRERRHGVDRRCPRTSRACAPSRSRRRSSPRRRTCAAAGAAVVIVVAHVGRRLHAVRPRPTISSSCEADSEIFQLARALPAGHGRRDRRRSHPRRRSPTASPASRSSSRTTTGRAFGRIDLDRSHPTRSAADRRRAIFPPQDRSPKPGAAFRRATKARRWRPMPRSRPRSRPRWRPRARSARRSWASRSRAPSRAPTPPSRALGNLFADLMRAARPEGRRRADQRRLAARRAAGRPAHLRPAPRGAAVRRSLRDDPDRRAPSWPRRSPATSSAPAASSSLSGVRAPARAASTARCSVTLTRPDGAPIGAGERLTAGHQRIPGDRRRRRVPGRGSRRAPGPTTAPPIRDAMADLLRARKTPLDPDNPPLYDAAHPRLGYPGRRPVRCRAARDRAFSRAAVQPLSLRAGSSWPSRPKRPRRRPA